MSDSTNPLQHSVQGTWSSKWAFILVTTGAAVGLGNIWKFPYIAGENGGGSFVLVYLICIVLVGIPLMIAELAIGRLAHENPIHAMRDLALRSNRSALWEGVAALGVLAGAIILSYYSLIAGWAFKYVFISATGHLQDISASGANTLFNTFLANPLSLMFWHTLIMFITVVIAIFGINKGIERSVCYLFPSMLVILFVLLGYVAVTSDHFMAGFLFLFEPNFEAITAQSILLALGHAFFTLSLSIGVMMAYGAYVGPNISLPKTSCIIAAGDTLIALLMGLIIFPLVFAYGLQPDSGPGLIYLTLPVAFGAMPFGNIFAVLFFLMIVFAALATTISFLEPSVAWLTEKFNFTRKYAAILAGIIIWLFGLLSVFSYNIWAGYQPFGMNLFVLIDYIDSNILLPVGGFLTSIFAVWVLNKRFLFKGLGLTGPNWFYYCFRIVLGVIAPIGIGLVFLDVIGVI